MSTKARVLQGLGAALAVGAALFAGAPGASADDALPVPAPPHLISAVVTGCHAPCAIGQSGDVVLTWEQSPPPASDVRVDYRQYANDLRLAEVDWVRQDSNTITMAIPICASDWSRPYCYPAYVDALRGHEVMTVTAFSLAGDPDQGTLRISAESAHSNGLVPAQG
jgi:hypothetical protein